MLTSTGYIPIFVVIIMQTYWSNKQLHFIIRDDGNIVHHHKLTLKLSKLINSDQRWGNRNL